MPKAKAMKNFIQVLAELEEFDKKCRRMTQLLGYRSSEIPKMYKQFISLCNSLAIVFLQFELNQVSFNVLNRAVQCDVSMFFEGNIEDRTWYGRALLYCNLGYLMLLVDDVPSSLKFLYDAESLILEIKEMATDADYHIEDLTLAHSALTFTILSKISRMSNAQKYLDIALYQFNQIAKKQRQTKISKVGIANLYCLLVSAMKITKAHIEGRSILAAGVCQSVLEKVNDRDIASALLLEKYSQSSERGIDMINSDEFRSIIFVTSFFPFITASTPVIDFEELVNLQNRMKGEPVDLSDLGMIGSSSDTETDLYSLIMQEALNSIKTGV